jgi:hypothetical protein
VRQWAFLLAVLLGFVGLLLLSGRLGGGPRVVLVDHIAAPEIQVRAPWPFAWRVADETHGWLSSVASADGSQLVPNIPPGWCVEWHKTNTVPGAFFIPPGAACTGTRLEEGHYYFDWSKP